ncbi:MAG: hypothetical protein ACP5O6_11665, partial [Candidatus Baltobacteraceae bacterium]
AVATPGASAPTTYDSVSLLAITTNGCSSAGCSPTLASYPQPTPNPASSTAPATNGFLNPHPGYIALGGDGNLWVADDNADALTDIGLPCSVTAVPPCTLAQGPPASFTMPASGAPYNAILGVNGTTVIATSDSNVSDGAGLLEASSYAFFPPFTLSIFPPATGGPAGPATGLAAAPATASVASYGTIDVYSPTYTTTYGWMLQVLAPTSNQILGPYKLELGGGSTTGGATIPACPSGGIAVTGTIAQAGAIATDAQGNLWLSARTLTGATPSNAQVFVEIAPFSTGLCGKAIVAAPTSAVASQIILGPDGNLWFIVPGVSQIYRLAPTLVGSATPAIAAFPQTPLVGVPIELAPGGDGNIWFTETGGMYGALELH